MMGGPIVSRHSAASLRNLECQILPPELVPGKRQWWQEACRIAAQSIGHSSCVGRSRLSIHNMMHLAPRLIQLTASYQDRRIRIVRWSAIDKSLRQGRWLTAYSTGGG